MIRRLLSVLVVALLTAGALAAFTFAPSAAPAPLRAARPAELARGCQRAILANNSGNGPNWRVVICYLPEETAPDHMLQLIVDGGPVGPGATIFAAQVRVP